jgi:hypothetical protein
VVQRVGFYRDTANKVTHGLIVVTSAARGDAKAGEIVKITSLSGIIPSFSV